MALWTLYGMLLVLLLFIRIMNKRIGGGGGGWKIIGIVGDDKMCGNTNLVL